jgi:hypothetical protein
MKLSRHNLFLVLFLLLSGKMSARFKQKTFENKKNTIVISVALENFERDDTLTLEVWDHFYSDLKKYQVSHRIFRNVAINNKFSFSIHSVKGPVYFSLGKDNHSNNIGAHISVLSHHGGDALYLAEPGDSLHFAIGKENIIFSGTETEKCRLIYDLMSVKEKEPFIYAYYKADIEKKGNGSLKTIDYRIINLRLIDSIFRIKAFKLNQCRQVLTDAAFQIIQADLIGERDFKKLQYLYYSDIRLINNYKQSDGSINENQAQIIDSIKDISLNKHFIPGEYALKYSKEYLMASELSCFLRSKIVGRGEDELQVIVNGYKGIFRDRLITQLFLDRYEALKDGELLLKKSLRVIGDKSYFSIVKNLYNRNIKGAIAYNFSLPNINDKLIQLSDLRGRVVFMDFWFVGCGHCMQFYQNSLSKVEAIFENNQDILFVTICINNKEEWLRGIKSGVYTSSGKDNVINLYTAGKGFYHPVISENNVNGYPHPLIINKAGKVFMSSNIPMEEKELISVLNRAIAHRI